MPASLAITPERLPLGLTAVKFWSRDRFEGPRALKRKVDPTRVPIESMESIRWLDNLASVDRADRRAGALRAYR